MYSINIWSLVTATIVAFVIGAIWYSPILFGKEWMALTKMTDKDIADAKTKGIARSYIAQFILTLITFIVLAFAIDALDTYGASNGGMVAFLAWIGFMLPLSLGSILWEKKSFKFVLITSVYTLISWIIGGAIIGGWN